MPAKVGRYQYMFRFTRQLVESFFFWRGKGRKSVNSIHVGGKRLFFFLVGLGNGIGDGFLKRHLLRLLD